MAYTAVPSLSTGYLWTAADNNTYIKDNFAAGVPDIFTTKGDIAVGATGGDIAARLGVGTDGHVLTADSAQTYGLQYAAIAYSGIVARYKKDNDQSIASAAAAEIVEYNVLVYDPGSDVTTGASWNYAAPATGYYLVAASALLESNAGWADNEEFNLQVFVNGSLYSYLCSMFMQEGGTYSVFITGATIVYAVAAQTIDVRAVQNSGGAINIDADGNYSHIAIARLF